MEAEDFGLLASLALGAMFGLGTKGEGEPREGHSPTFDIDEPALPIGAAILAETTRRYLG
jgi:metal-dependent amidase/aminoacylase/carboxypeptidase family protein